MGVLHLTEREVRDLIDIDSAMDCLDVAFREWAAGEADNQPRRRVVLPGAWLHMMSAGSAASGYLACKTYVTGKAGMQFHLLLYHVETAQLVAMMDANWLGQIRTGAATGVATRLLSRTDSRTLGCFGTGFQARSQIEAVCAVRDLERIVVYSRNDDRRNRFAEEMSLQLGIPVHAAHRPEEAVVDQDMIITATTSRTPVFEGQWLSKGTHIAAVGGNHLGRAEIDTTAIARANLVVCDNIEACQLESGELVSAAEAGQFEWSRARNLADVLTGKAPGRAGPDEITLFKSVGLGLEDLAVGVYVYNRALEEGVGQRLPI